MVKECIFSSLSFSLSTAFSPRFSDGYAMITLTAENMPPVSLRLKHSFTADALVTIFPSPFVFLRPFLRLQRDLRRLLHPPPPPPARHA